MRVLPLPTSLLLFLKGRRVHASFSGGADSLALLLSLREAAGQGAFSLSAVHFEHGLRGRESLDDAEFCRALCERIGVPLTVISLGMKPGPDVEAKARARRHAEWKRILAGDPTGVVALGHTADDRIETLFLRLLRGSNVSGLAALRPIRVVDGVTYVRPLLTWGRNDTERVASPYGPRTDSSNRSDAYLRNRIRNRLLPELQRLDPGARAALLRACDATEEDAAFLESAADALYAPHAGQERLPLSFLRSMEPAMLPRILRRFLSERMKKDVVPNRAATERLRRMLDAASSEARRIPVSGRALVLSRDGLAMEPENRREPPSAVVWRFRETPVLRFGDRVLRLAGEGTDLPTPENECAALFDAELLGGTLQVAAWRPGERMTPFGGFAPCRLKKLFSNARIPSWERTSFPVVRTPDGTPVWIPEIRRSSFASAVPGRSALLFRCERVLRVVAVVLAREGRILACSRPAGKPHAGMWEFPGGKIEPGETPEACAAREVREELGAEIETIGPVHEMEHDYGSKYVHVTFYAAKLRSGEPRGREGQELRWARADELDSIPFLPADRPFADSVRRIFSGTEAIKWDAASFYERMSARMEQHGTAS